jgi:hypothetical protein
MKVSNQRDGENVGSCWPQQYGGLDLVPFDPVALPHKRDAVSMDGVRNFMAQSSRQLLGVLREIKQRIHDIHVATRRGEGVRLSFVDQEELEGMGIARLSYPRNRVRKRFQGVIEG